MLQGGGAASVCFRKPAASFARAARRADGARARGPSVIVTVDADDALLEIGALKPDWVQAHGNESPSASRTRGFRPAGDQGAGRGPGGGFGGRGRVQPAWICYCSTPPPPGADLPGGNALAFDWVLMGGRRFSRPWMPLAGSIPAMREAITASGAGLVDVSSGVSRPA